MLGTTRFVCDRSSSQLSSSDEELSIQQLFGFPLQLLNDSMKALKKSVRPSSMSVGGNQQQIELRPIKQDLTFCQLPVPVRWMIFSYLDSKSLCSAAMVSMAWFHLAGDELLWRRLLKNDLHKWDLIGHLSHPDIFKEVASDLTAKEIYLRCHPSRQNQNAGRSLLNWRLPFHLPRWFRQPLRVAMFGPGLDTMPLVRKMIFEPDAPYKPTGMFPGSDGVGSGICIRHAEHSINLITLYSATKEERQQVVDGQAVNRLVGASRSSDEDGEDTNNSDDNLPPISFHIQELCKTVDAFVCIVDASSASKGGVQQLVHAMVGNRSQCRINAPLLVYAAVESSADQQKVSCAQLADNLELTKLSRPWQVRSLNLDEVQHLSIGFDWLLSQCRS